MAWCLMKWRPLSVLLKAGWFLYYKVLPLPLNQMLVHCSLIPSILVTCLNNVLEPVYTINYFMPLQKRIQSKNKTSCSSKQPSKSGVQHLNITTIKFIFQLFFPPSITIKFTITSYSIKGRDKAKKMLNKLINKPSWLFWPWEAPTFTKASVFVWNFSQI